MTFPAYLCVFCGAQRQVPAHFLALGAAFGNVVAARGITLVYGGGATGVMGAVADAVLAAGGKVVGVYPSSLGHIEREHEGLSEIVHVDSMHARKQAMYERSDAFIILPGGFGTLDEMFEILTWKQIRLHEKPVILLNAEGYWNPLVQMMDQIIASGFAPGEMAGMYQVAHDLEEIFRLLS